MPNKHRVVYYGKKIQPRPKWMRVVRIFSLIILVIVMILAMIGIAIKYYHLVTKH
jgi:putative copper export protein